MTRLDLFFSYSEADEALRDQLETHLALLKREGVIRPWHHRRIVAGESRQDVIDARLEAADIILLLISADFIASDYCYEREMQRALQRHGDAEDVVAVVPILVRPCDWESSPFGGLQPLPSDRQPVQTWADQDEALLDVVTGLRQLIAELHRQRGLKVDGQRDENQGLQEALEIAYEQRADLLTERGNTSDVDREIRRIKRELRKGGQLRAGDVLLDGRLRLKSPLGEGGYGTVWKAYDKESQRVVAVKVLHSRNSRDPGRRDRFFRGARWMAQLHDVPGIVDVFEPKCEDDGFYFFVMEYVAGSDFRRAVESETLALDERIGIVLEVGDVLQTAHERDVVHRDVKPDNILLDQDGRVRLTDFDLVAAPDTIDDTTSALGTYRFAAPEALEGGSRAEVPADVFSLGMTMLFALHGELSIEARNNIPEFLDRLDISPAWREVLDRALHPKPEARWPSVGAFCEAIRALPADGILDPSRSESSENTLERQSLAVSQAGHSRFQEILARRASEYAEMDGSTIVSASHVDTAVSSIVLGNRIAQSRARRERSLRVLSLAAMLVVVFGLGLVLRSALDQPEVPDESSLLKVPNRHWVVDQDATGRQRISFLGEQDYEGSWADPEAGDLVQGNRRWSVRFSAYGHSSGGQTNDATPRAADLTFGFLLRSQWFAILRNSDLEEWLDHARLWRAVPDQMTVDFIRETFGEAEVRQVEARVEIAFDQDTLEHLVHGVLSHPSYQTRAKAEALAAAMAWRDDAARQSPTSRREAFGEIWNRLLEDETRSPTRRLRGRELARFWGLAAADHLEGAGLSRAAFSERNAFPSPASGTVIPYTMSGLLFLNGSPLDELDAFFRGLHRWRSVLPTVGNGEVAAPDASYRVVEAIYEDLQDMWQSTHLMRATGALLVDAAVEEGILDQVDARFELREPSGEVLVSFSPQGYTGRYPFPGQAPSVDASRDE